MDKIDFDAFREKHQIRSTAARSILKQLEYEVVREDDKQFIIGKNRWGIDNNDYLTNAVKEYRQLVSVDYTKRGKMWWIAPIKEQQEQIEALKLLSNNPKLQLYDTALRPPNKQPEKIAVEMDAVVGITNQQVKKENISITPIADAAPTAPIQALAAALVEAQKAAAPPDPLAPQKALREAAEQEYLLTTEQLSQLIGMSKSTISSKKSGFRKLGHEYEKIKEGSTTLWKVSKY